MQHLIRASTIEAGRDLGYAPRRARRPRDLDYAAWYALVAGRASSDRLLAGDLQHEATPRLMPTATMDHNA